MLLKIDRSALSDLIARGGVSATRNAVIPIMSHVLLRAEEGALHATTCDLDMQASAVAKAEVEVPGSICVDAQALKLFADRLPPAAMVKIEMEADRLTVSAGRMRARLGVLPASDYPSVQPVQDDAARFVLAPDEMAKLFGRTVVAAEKGGGTRYYLEGVFLRARDGLLRAVATNGHALITSAVSAPEGAVAFGKPEQGGVIIPSETVGQALRLFARESVRVAVTETRIEFAGETSSIVSKVVDGSFPDFERVIPATCANQVTLDRASALNAIGVVEVFQSRDSGSQIECGEDPEGLAMSVAHNAEGEGYALAEAEFSGSFPTFGVSSKYLRIVLGAFTSEHVVISLADPGSPLRFFVDGDDSVTGVVMPMRVRRTTEARA